MPPASFQNHPLECTSATCPVRAAGAGLSSSMTGSSVRQTQGRVAAPPPPHVHVCSEAEWQLGGSEKAGAGPRQGPAAVGRPGEGGPGPRGRAQHLMAAFKVCGTDSAWGNWFQSGLCHLACEPRVPIGHRAGADPPDCWLPGHVRLDPISSPHYRSCEGLWHYLYFSRA